MSESIENVGVVEIEVTPEMIEVGVESVSYGFRGKGEPDGYDEIAIAVYRSMERVRRAAR